jgi:HK97 family phage portal protein
MKFSLPIIGDVTIGEQPTIMAAPQEKALFDALGGFLDLARPGLSGEKDISSKLLQANRGWVFRNNDAIAQEVSKLEFELYTVGLSAGEIVYNEVNQHPLLDLLDRPNQESTKTDSIYIIQSHKKLTGDAFWLKLRDRTGQTVALRILPPDKVHLDLQSPTEKDPTIIMSFTYKDVINGEKVEITYDPKDIIHFKKPNPNNIFRGLGAVEAMADTIDLDNLTTEVTKQFFKNGAITNFVLSTESKITSDQLHRLQAELRAQYAGASKAYQTMILGGGLKPVDISYSNKELEFLAQLEWYRDKIMYGFGNTKASLGMIDDVNRASHEGSIIEWQRNTVKPDMQSIVDTLNEFLVPEFGDNLVLGFTDPVPEDRADDIEEATKLYAGNIIMRSEARELLDYESDDSDNVYYAGVGATTTPDELTPGDNDENVDQEVDEADED